MRHCWADLCQLYNAALNYAFKFPMMPRAFEHNKKSNETTLATQFMWRTAQAANLVLIYTLQLLLFGGLRHQILQYGQHLL